MNKPSPPATVVPIKRMTLASVRKGRLTVPLRILGYGPEGVGKSTFAAGAPKPIFLNVDRRTAGLDIDRIEPTTWDEALEVLSALDKESHDYQTIVVDPINWLEPMAFAKVTGGSTPIDKWEGGYGKGRQAALDHWRQLIAALERLWTTKNMNVILLAHAAVKNFADPEGPPYDRYELAMDKGAAGLLRQWCDWVLFMRHEAFAKADPGRKARGYSTGARVIHTQYSAAYDAKADAPVPSEIPLSWAEFTQALESVRSAADAAKAEIASLLEEIADTEVTRKATAYVADAKNNPGKLAEIANALRVKLNKETPDQ
jgi:hypothetical protein